MCLEDMTLSFFLLFLVSGICSPPRRATSFAQRQQNSDFVCFGGGDPNLRVTTLHQVNKASVTLLYPI